MIEIRPPHISRIFAPSVSRFTRSVTLLFRGSVKKVFPPGDFRCLGQDTHDRLGDDGFPGSGFTNQRDCLAGGHTETDAVDGAYHSFCQSGIRPEVR